MADKPTVLLTEPVFPEVIELLEKHTDLTVGKRGQFNDETALIQVIPNYNGLLCMLSNPVTPDVIKAGKKLHVIANHAVGVNNIDLKAAQKNEIPVANTPDVLTETTADGIMALMLATARRIPEAERALRKGEFDGWHPTGFLGMDFPGKKLGIIGMGRIGQAVAKRASAFGLKILYHNRSRLSPEIESACNAEYRGNTADLIAESDIISLSCPLNEDTHHLINAEMFDRMKSSAILINASRGPVVNEADLARALHSEKIAGAGIDVYENEPKIHPNLLTAPNCVLLPHITSATAETRKKMGMLAAGAILNKLCGLDMECYFLD